jgi:hypothetical protein
MKVKKSMKYQKGGPVPKAPAKKDSVESEMFPGKMIPKEKSNYENKNFDKMFKSAPKKSAAPTTKKKMKEGGSLGMKSVKAGYDKNPGVTRADIIVAAKGEAKYGTKMKKAKSGAALKKQAATAIAMKKAGKAPKKMMMKMGGKCKYGC